MSGSDIKHKLSIIPPALVERFEELRRFCYEADTPERALEMVDTVFRECNEAIDNYDQHALPTLVLPALEAAKDALVAVGEHLLKSGASDEARLKWRNTMLTVGQMLASNQTGQVQL